MATKTLKEASNKLYNFAEQLVGSRILDVYLKYRGIKLLTTSTLVPLALVYGRDQFEAIIKKFVQQGGNIPKELPVIDDPLLGTYLKMAGLTSISLTPETLLPIGIIMAVYEMFIKDQKGEGILEEMETSNSMYSHRINLSSIEEINHEVINWIKIAYKKSIN